jgi:hypothetical protein
LVNVPGLIWGGESVQPLSRWYWFNTSNKSTWRTALASVSLCVWWHNLLNNFVHSLSRFSVYRSKLPVRLLSWYSIAIYMHRLYILVNWWRRMKLSLWTVYVLVTSALDHL